MNRRAALRIVFWAVSVGAAITILNGDRRAVSLRLWLACFVIWFGVASVRRLLEGVPLVPPHLKALFVIRRPKPAVDESRLRELRSLEALLLRSRENDRAFVQQLQPRVVALADHFLPVTHGIDRHAYPERAQQILGDLGWMLEPGLSQRTPTLHELDELVARLTHSSGTRTEEATRL